MTIQKEARLEQILQHYLDVKRAIHELASLPYGGSDLKRETNYNTLKDILKLSDGNLHRHLSRLEREEYINSSKSFIRNRSNTSYKITEKGLVELKDYLEVTINVLRTIEDKLEELSEK